MSERADSAPSSARYWGPRDLRIDFEAEYGANVSLGHGIVVELARNEAGGWEVWGVQIDGHLYREPRDLEGEALKPGPFADILARAEKEARDGD